VNPKTVIVETNWVVDIIAPAHLQDLQAIKLLTRARDGEINLFVPAICFAEARETVPRRFAPRSRSEDLRKFVRWAKSNGKVLPQDAEIALKVWLNRCFGEVKKGESPTKRLAKLYPFS
jgi:hypothetical protein